MRTIATAIASTVLAGPALAHVGQGAHGSAAAGLAHPLMGTDHLLAMVAVGLLAAGQPGAARWVMPTAFVGAVAAGIALAGAGVGLPLVETLILASVLALGILVALAVRLPVAAGAAMVAAFGLAHGAAHGAEVGSAEVLPFAMGVLASTALLHGAGIVAGSALARSRSAALVLRLVVGVGAVGLAIG